VALEPAGWDYQLTLAILLARQGEHGEARALAERVAARATEPEAANAAASALALIAESQAYEAQRPGFISLSAGPEPSSAKAPILVRRPPAAVRAPDPSEAPPTGAPGSNTRTTSSARLYSMQGDIVALDCRSAPEVTLTLRMGSFGMRLRAADLSKVAFLTPAGGPRSGAITCTQLRGMAAQIQYTLTGEELYDGEIRSIAPLQ
jgi:hypothetical protein